MSPCPGGYMEWDKQDRGSGNIKVSENETICGP
jgi:hypothetical protein